jgi:hypothetical protein
MTELLRERFVDRQDKTRGSNTKLFFYDYDGKRVDEITVKEANNISSANPSQLFYIADSAGFLREWSISDVNSFFGSSDRSLTFDADCSTLAQPCGPPLLSIFGGGGIGASANPIISPISSSVIAFDIIDSGKNYLTEPFAQLIDICGNGSGSKLQVVMEPYSGTTGGSGLQVKNITIKSPGNGYLSTPDGSLGGDGRIIKKPEEGLLTRNDGTYEIIPPNITAELNPGDTFIPPSTSLPTSPISIGPTYPIVLEIEDIDIINPGFGYQPGDKLIVNPDRGAVLEPIIDNGRIIKVNVINSGIGFDDFPQITTNSITGYNFSSRPIFRTRRLDEKQELIIPKDAEIISVIDCVGRVF